jgi:hypothetical protein
VRIECASCFDAFRDSPPSRASSTACEGDELSVVSHLVFPACFSIYRNFRNYITQIDSGLYMSTSKSLYFRMVTSRVVNYNVL